MRRISNPLPQLVPQRVRRARARVEAALWRGARELAATAGPVNTRPVDLQTAMAQTFAPVRPGERFGPAGGGWQQRWFRLDLPTEAESEGDPYLHWHCLAEATVYVEGTPWAGLDFAHPSCRLPRGVRTLWVDSTTYATGIRASVAPPIGPHGVEWNGARVVRRDPLAWKVAADLDVFSQLLVFLLEDGGHEVSDRRYGHQAALDRASPLLRILLRGLDVACDAFDREGLAAFSGALDGLRSRLPAEAWQPAAAIAPQTHIDLVWLWPEEEAERKGVHSMATALRLMEDYPGFTFTFSQPALFRALERRAPALASALRERAREGRLEALGGFEVEPDTQLPCGEALARSLVIGQAKLAELRDGKPNEICWLPDVFGYSACLPQILRLGGVKHFFTTKLRWSAVTRFPYQSFVWRGNDGSEVLAQISTAGYTGVCDVEPLVLAARDFGQADVSPAMLLAQGYGDGGGGPTEAMCERVARMEDLAGVPRTRFSRAEDFFAGLERVRDDLPVYQGELYLEYHRGTYTTQSELKRLYRRAESALQAHEAVRVLGGRGPIDDGPWQRLAFAQFHDALPGSSIGLVYEQLVPELGALGDAELNAATRELGELAGGGATSCAWNPLPLPRRVVVDGPSGPALVELPALGHAVPGAATTGEGGVREATPQLLDNGIVRAELDANGGLVGLAVGGERIPLVAPGGLVLYPDQPAMFDAWDIDHAALRLGERAGALKLAVHERGPVRAVLRGELLLGRESRARIDWILEAGSPWLKVELEVDWREDHRLLKFHLPTAHRGRHARFGAPFGSVLRPQQPGDAADEAMWEVPGARWAGVTDDDGRGAAIVTEAKYGFSCRDGNLGLSLLRAPADPDPRADRGVHRMRFALGRHVPRTEGSLLSTAAAADALYAPVLGARGNDLPPPPLRWGALGSLVPCWAVPALGGGFVIRAHETMGERGAAELELRDPGATVTLVDLLGNPVADAAPVRRGGRTVVPYRPYQILSLLVR